ncbi:hypothetical protein pipiens_005423 [Culex pipiens pipiens]|uniref:Uncharacterized protein n=1 Tax=Culex pipiens pipiens TaxID=38569 RepID=A0ABD1DWU5_CULPP
MTESVLSGSTALFEQEEADDTLVAGAEQVIPSVPASAEIPVIAYFSSSDGKEYIRVEQQMPWKVDQLNCTARLANAKTMLFWQLRIVRILQDVLTADRNRCRADLLTSINWINTNDAIQLLEIIQSSEDLDYRSLCEKLRENTVISASLREQAVQLVPLEDAVARRNRFLNRFHPEFSDHASRLEQPLKQFRVSVIENHLKSLLKKSPEYLQSELKNVSETILIRINVSDVKVFHDMDRELNPDIFKAPLQGLAKRWLKHVENSKHSNGFPTNPIYLSLCRSLEELIQEITSKSSHKKEELIRSDSSGWHPLKTIAWKLCDDFTKCLEREYRFNMKLLKHFDPASGNTKPFDYQPHRLIDGTRVNEPFPMIRSIFQRLSGSFQTNPVEIADEFYVWYCLLDDALANVLHNRDAFEHILQNYVLLISNATIDQMETIRVITHNTLRFIVQTVPFLDSKMANSCEDKQILQLQLDAVNRLVAEPRSKNSIRELIGVFSRYWENRNSIIENIPSKQAIPEMEQIKTSLITVVLIALQKNVSAVRLVDFFRTYNDFLIDLDYVSFDWLIKPVAVFNMNNLKIVETVETKKYGTDIAVFRAINPKKKSNVVEKREACPEHYVVEIVTKLLGYVISQLQHTRWTSGSDLADHEQIESAAALISAISSSLLYLEEQVVYISYDFFMEERLKLFSNVRNTCSSRDC